MKKLATIALLLAAALQAESRAYLAPLGSWMLCDAGLSGPWCAPGGIPRGTYALFVRTDNEQAVAFRYTVSVHLKDGSTESKSDVVKRAAESVTVAPMMFAAAVVSSEVTVQELVPSDAQSSAR